MLLTVLRMTNVLISVLTLYPAIRLLTNFYHERINKKVSNVSNSLILLMVGVLFGAVSNVFFVFTAFAFERHTNALEMNVTSILLRIAFFFAVVGLYRERTK